MDKKAPPEPKKPAQKPESGEPVLQNPNLARPGLIFLLLLIPLLLVIFNGFYEKSPAPVTPIAAPAKAERQVVQYPPMAGGGGVPGAGRGAAPCGFAGLKGQRADDQSVLSRIQATGKAYRVLPPGSAMTMDYSEDRINLELDDKGIIRRVWCG